MLKQYFYISFFLFSASIVNAQLVKDTAHPLVRTEVVMPMHKNSFMYRADTICKERIQGGNPQKINGYQVFNGAMDGNRQVDPQIAVGGGYVMHGTNAGFVIYTKDGKYVQGTNQKCFNDGIDPKMCFDIHNRVFVFDLWWYYDKAKTKPVNISVSETDNPTASWNTYAISETEAKDGGAIGYSKKWIGYSFPGGEYRTFVLKTAEAKAGKPATIYHFKGSLGHPVFVQDDSDDLYFFEIEKNDFVIRKITTAANGEPECILVAKTPHNLKYFDWPPQSLQKGTKQKVSSGDRNPKNVVLQNGSIWFSHAVNVNGKAAVQWHQLNVANGTTVQTGLINNDETNYIQTTIAVNKNNDVLIGFQQADSTRFISPRFAFRKANDKPGIVRKIVSAGEGAGATDGVAWGDYSGSIIDGDNLTDLWTVQSRANEKGRGETVIIKVPFKNKKKKNS